MRRVEGHVKTDAKEPSFKRKVTRKLLGGCMRCTRATAELLCTRLASILASHAAVLSECLSLPSWLDASTLSSWAQRPVKVTVYGRQDHSEG